MRLRELSIIQYQNVSDRAHLNKMWLPIGAFIKQIEYLSANNFQGLSIDEAIDYMLKKNELKAKQPISLTFDNGYMDFYEHAFPVISDHGFPGTVLISPEKVGKEVDIGTNKVPYLTWGILKELLRNNVTIGAYEDYATKLKDVPEDVIQKHIVEYKKILEDKLGEEIRYFGIKEGVPNSKIRDLLISEGYKAFLTECPTYQKPDLYSIARIQVDDDDFNILLTKISRTYLFFKDKKTWKYIREYSLNKVAHKISETWDKIRGIEFH